MAQQVLESSSSIFAYGWTTCYEISRLAAPSIVQCTDPILGCNERLQMQPQQLCVQAHSRSESLSQETTMGRQFSAEFVFLLPVPGVQQSYRADHLPRM